MKLKDVTGNSLLAIEVLGLSIQALTSHMEKLLDNEGTNIKPHEIKWVLTVPAIWSDSAKQFMRKSVEKVFRIQQIIIIYYYHMQVNSNLMPFVKALPTAFDKVRIRHRFKIYSVQVNVKFQYLAHNQHIFIS